MLFLSLFGNRNPLCDLKQGGFQRFSEQNRYQLNQKSTED